MNRFSFFIIIFPIFFISCSSSNEPIDDKNEILEHNGYFLFSTNSKNHGDSIYKRYSFNGVVYETRNDKYGKNGGELIFCNLKFEPQQNEFGNWVYGRTVDYIPEELSNEPGLGQISRFELEGNKLNNIPGFKDSFYVPEEITIQKPIDKEVFSRSDIIKIVWNKDDLSDSVIVGFTFNRNDKDTSIYKEIKDNGEFDFDLSIINTGHLLNVYIIRNFEKVIYCNDKSYYISIASNSNGFYTIE